MSHESKRVFSRAPEHSLTGGFTVVELLVVFTIIAVSFGIILIDRETASENQALARSANLLAVDLRRAQTFALAAPTLSGSVLGGFGIEFSIVSPSSYTMFVDENGNHAYDPPVSNACPDGECLEQRALEGNIAFGSLSAGPSVENPLGDAGAASLTVIFCPPYADIFIYGSGDEFLPGGLGTNCSGNKDVMREYATIFLASPVVDAPNVLQHVRVYASGGVDILDDAAAAQAPDTSYAPASSTLPPPQPPSSSFAARINFQKPNTALYPGYLPDYGAMFGDRGNGLQYGWACSTGVPTTVDRDEAISPDQRYDTFARLNNFFGCLGAKWEFELPQDGLYQVTLVAGDPDPVEGPVSSYSLYVEGQPVLVGSGSTEEPWLVATLPVNATASDRRVTITGLPLSSLPTQQSTNKINFIVVKKF